MAGGRRALTPLWRPVQAKLKDPHCVRMQKKNAIVPFQDPSSFEFFSSKADASLFVFGSHSKKRPNNLVLVRGVPCGAPDPDPAPHPTGAAAGPAVQPQAV